jgi:DNA mismatch endonuclease, patch repair protein
MHRTLPYYVTDAVHSRVIAAVKSKRTTPELSFWRWAHAVGFRFRLHVGDLPGCPDLVFPRLGKIIDVRGCFWHLHGCKRCRVPSSRGSYWLPKLQTNACRDKATVRKLRRIGWKVLVVWECQTVRLDSLQRRIARFLMGTNEREVPARSSP